MTIVLRLPGREGESTIDTGPCPCGGVRFHVTTWVVVAAEAVVDEGGHVLEPQRTRAEGRIVCEKESCVRSKNGELVVGVLDVSTGQFAKLQPTLRTSYAPLRQAREPSPPGPHRPGPAGDAGHDPFPGCPLDRADPANDRWGQYVPDPRDQEYYRRKLQEGQQKEAKRKKTELRRRLKARGGLVEKEDGMPLYGDPDKLITKRSKK